MLLKTTDTLGFTKLFRSQNIILLKQSLMPSPVLDGPVLGHDLRTQASVASLSANWQPFGIPGSALTLNGSFNGARRPTVERYEVAVGSGSEIDNVMAFRDVGLKTLVTFQNLRLTPGVTYHVTVRASSKYFTSVQQSSDGVTIGVNATVKGKQCSMKFGYNTVLCVQITCSC